MRHDQFVLRCYVERQGDVCVAVCVDLTLAAQADTMDEARRKLDAQIGDFLHDIFSGDEREHIEDLFPRRAPLKYVAKYQWIRLLWKVARMLDKMDEARSRPQAFRDFWPAHLAGC